MWEKFVPEMCRTRKEVHILDLTGGEEAVFDKLHKSAKKGIKTAERCGVRIESESGDQLLGIFFELTYAARAQWAGQQHEPVWLAQLRGRFRDSERKWTNVANHIGPNLRVYVAWCNDRPAAAGIVLQGHNVHGARAAMDREVANRSGATHALNWAVIKDACASGARSFHMGESATKGAADFKRFLGADCVAFDEIDYERFPVSRANRATRSLVKKVVGFKGDEVNAAVS
jgi:lipid II:glycine glycyltransferase (peptidoglycan interpeptide bridge formation enzyme)